MPVYVYRRPRYTGTGFYATDNPVRLTPTRTQGA
jgi:hypothetical protein